MTCTASVAVIGGSGLYDLFEPGSADRLDVPTPFGPTSAPITVGTLAGTRVAFLPRHGEGHTVAPHLIPYRANVWALASLGVKALISSSAVGGLHPGVPPGTFVIPDQYLDRTSGRDDTFYEHTVAHLPSADPYCPVLRTLAADSLRAAGAPGVRDGGTVVVIQGPRFSTRAESRWYRSMGGDVVNMTQYPEAALAAELNVGSVTLGFVTDSDAGDSSGDHPPVTADIVFDRVAAAQPVIRSAVARFVRDLPPDYESPTLMDPGAVNAVLGARPASTGRGGRGA